jgi:putative MATE family efflux protein
MIITNTLTMLGPTIDMIWVGKLGSASIAGVGVAGMAVMVVNSARMGLTTGTRAMIARFIGADDARGANHVAQQTIVVSAAFSIFMAIIGISLAEPIMRIMGVEADVVAEGAAYMRIMFVGSVAMSFRMMNESIMQASGDSVTPMRIAIAFRIFHVALCPFLVFGWWIFPRLGVSGAALTNVISQSLGVGLGLWVLCGGRSRLRLSFRGFDLDWNIVWRIVRIGIPASVTGIERSFANLVLMWFIVPFGTFAVASHTVVDRVSQFLHMPSMGLGQGAGVLAGQNLGARQPGRAERTGWLAAGLFSAIMIISSILVFFFAGNIVRIFNAEPGLVKIASTFLRIEIVAFLVFGLVVVLSQCLNGVGDTVIPMLTTLLTMWLVQVPLAYFLPRITGLGVYGVRWAIVSAIVMRAVIYTTYFRSGRWKRKRV